MKFKRLYINDKIFCNFHDGLNIILGINLPPKDQTENKSADTNGVGKSMIVNCLRYVLGTNASGIFDLPYFAEKKYWAHLEIVKNNTSHVLIRPLFSTLKKYSFIYDGTLESWQQILADNSIELSNLENEKDIAETLGGLTSLRSFTDDEYINELCKIENLDYGKTRVKLPSILDFLIRQEKRGYDDIIEMHERTNWVQYRTVQYLFGLPSNLEQESSSLKEEISTTQAELNLKKKELSLRHINSVDTITNRRITFSKELEKIRNELKSIKVIPTLEDVRKTYQEKRAQLFKLNETLNLKENYLVNYKTALNTEESKEKSLKSLINVDQFYADLVGFFPKELKENIDSFKSFFSSVGDDRQDYYKDLISKTEQELKLFKTQKKSLSEELNTLSSRFSNTSIIGDISAIASREEKVFSEIKDLDLMEKYLVEVENLEEKLEKQNAKRTELINTGKADEKKNRSERLSLIKAFRDYVESVYGTSDGSLEFKFNSNMNSSTAGRTDISCWLPAHGSMGRGAAMIVLFDFVWFFRKRGNEEFDPNFLVHDGPFVVIGDVVKPKILDLVVELLSETDKQYLITANEHDIPNLATYRKYVCKELDGSQDSSKFFGEQFYDRMV